MGSRAKSVLLIDDNAYVRRALRNMFEAAGFECTEFETGAAAIEKADQLKPDLIVLDFSMPVMNGLEAAPLLREKLPQTPIIMLTMFASRALEDIVLAAGVTILISKDRSHDLVSRASSLLNPPSN
jgi:CheY-like chemotaxis protein